MTEAMRDLEQLEREYQIVKANAALFRMVTEARAANDSLLAIELWGKVAAAALDRGYLRLCSYALSKIANRQDGSKATLDAELVRFAKEDPRDAIGEASR